VLRQATGARGQALSLGALFINAWSQVTAGGVAASLAGMAIAGALCWLIARIIKEGRILEPAPRFLEPSHCLFQQIFDNEFRHETDRAVQLKRA
jgi:hypothetical protein